MPHTEQYASDQHPITVDVFLPTSIRRRPACLIFHGTFGLLPEYRDDIVSFAEALADAGLVAMLPRYFERTGTLPGLPAGAAMVEHLPAWRTACSDALSFAHNHPRIDGGRLGAIGFSLGGHLSLGLGMAPPNGAALKCVVDFFGPTLAPRLAGNRNVLPPVQIHHGTDDTTVPIAESKKLVAELKAAGKTEGLGYQFFEYAGQGHGFTGADLSTARSRAVQFVTAAL